MTKLILKISGRSPAYPAIDLAQALELARRIYREKGSDPVSFTEIMFLWGYEPKSSNGRLNFAAVKSFGLINVLKINSIRHARLNWDARTLLTDDPNKSAERIKLLRIVAFRPKMHRRLWEKYGAVLPKDHYGLHQALLNEYGFSEAGAFAFQSQYRKTFAYVALSTPMNHKEELTPFRDTDVSPQIIELSHEFGASRSSLNSPTQETNMGSVPSAFETFAHTTKMTQPATPSVPERDLQMRERAVRSVDRGSIESDIVREFLPNDKMEAFLWNVVCALQTKHGLIGNPSEEEFFRTVARSYRNEAIPMLLLTHYGEILENIADAVKAHHNPTIDFKLLHKLTIDATKLAFPWLFFVEPKPVSVEPSIEITTTPSLEINLEDAPEGMILPTSN